MCDALAVVAPDVRVEIVQDGAALLLRLIEGPTPDLVLLNRHLPRVDGLRVLAVLERRSTQARVVLWSDAWAPQETLRVQASGVASWVQKPATPEGITRW